MRSHSVYELLNLPSWSWTKYRPWTLHDDYCDLHGRCWFRKETDKVWILARPDNVFNVIACLPYYVMPPSTVGYRVENGSVSDSVAAIARRGGGVMAWQPIETAPRDGTFFIAANATEAIVCNWPKQEEVDYAIGNWRKGIIDEWNGAIIKTASKLTHWQPLPTLPLPSREVE